MLQSRSKSNPSLSLRTPPPPQNKPFPRTILTNSAIAPRFALNGSFQILLFLGDFSQDPSTWHHDARLVGIDAIFASHSLENCENCRQQNEEGLIDSDVIPLTTPLVAYWKSQEEVGGMKLKSLEVAEVKQFLRINLHWRVLDVSIPRNLQL
jgi:hypothetical protein